MSAAARTFARDPINFSWLDLAAAPAWRAFVAREFPDAGGADGIVTLVFETRGAGDTARTRTASVPCARDGAFSEERVRIFFERLLDGGVRLELLEEPPPTV